ncbi:amino acid permease [Paenibacillus sp. GCM10027628]|uniref:amino acid permease n=1 Tax=Paenibacillus sp. GCM10027628 TaxID=3273413 RepID=UPI0036257E37
MASVIKESNNQLKRSMKSRHMLMISLGGAIGTGLFVSTGYLINQAGPGGVILSYLSGGLLMYLVMLCLSELAVIMPVTGSFQVYATKFIGPATGFTIGWLYWINWIVAVGSEWVGAGMLMNRWFPHIPSWIWIAIVIVFMFLLNAFSASLFAESEFWFSSIKVITIALFVLLGIAAITGILPFEGLSSAPIRSGFAHDGGLFPNGFVPVFMTMVAVNFSYQGTELIGIAAGESENPEKEIPKATRNTIWRILLLFVASVFILSSLIPWKEAGLTDSPFVLVFDKMGIPFAADIMNFVILTALLSASNSGLYASSRMLWALSKSNMASPFLSKLSSRGVPFRALIVSAIIASVALISSIVAPDTVFLWLSGISGFAGILVWMGVALSHYLFRRRYIAEGNRLEDLKYKVKLFPFVPILAIILCLIALIGLAFDEEQKIALYYGIPFTIVCYGVYYLFYRSKYEQTVVEPRDRISEIK